MRRLVRRNAAGLFGLGILALTAAAAIALATWRVDDPSLSNAVDRPVDNLLGYPGAVVADLVMQFLGIAAPLLVLPGLLWGWRLLVGADVRFRRLTAVTWLAGILFAAAAAAVLPVPESWPLPTGLGGAAGDLLLRLPEALFGGVGGGLAIIIGGILALCAAGLLFHALGLGHRREPAPARPARRRPVRNREQPPAQRKARRNEEELDDFYDDPEDGRGRVELMLGALAHTGYRLGGAIRRAGRGARRAATFLGDDDTAREPSGRRREPRAPYPVPEPVVDIADPTDDPFDPDEEEAVPAPPAKRRAAARKRARAGVYQPPRPELLTAPRHSRQGPALSKEAMEDNARLLESVLDDFGIRGEIVHVRPGPVVTLYELEPAPGIKSSRVIGLADDIARSMSAIACRVAVIPGKNAIGIELPNERRETVYLRELLASEESSDSKARLPLCLGKMIGGEPVIADLSRMPHLLIAGTTGSGKSVAINTMILSLVYRLSPLECRLILIDPKMLELSVYDSIPHLLTPVVTDPKKAVVALKWTVREMENRYRKMSKVGVRNIDGLNARIAEAKSRGEMLSRTVHTGFDPDTGEPIVEREELDMEPMPFIVVIIDEMADLMMVAGKDIEGAVQRLAQMARAAGIHVVMATQRPSVDVITGTIKANFPTRISFQVTSKIDSRTILGEQGAEQLLGQGDMLYMMGGGRIRRVHGPFVTDDEVEKVVAHLKTQGLPEYLEAITEEDDSGGYDGFDPDGEGESDDLYDRAVAVVLRDRKVSTSYIQRRLSIGYNRAATLIERMEEEGVIGAPNHAGKREILVEGDNDRF